MSTSNRLRNRKPTPTADTPLDTSLHSEPSQTDPSSPTKRTRPKIFTNTTSSAKQSRESLYAQYQPHKQANPIGFQWTMQHFPANLETMEACSLPLGFSFSPLLALENQHAVVMEKNIEAIPRCGACRAYMNCYNVIEKDNKFRCFICGTYSFIGQYHPENEPNLEMNSSIYQAIGSPNFYPDIPSQQTIIFLIDISKCPQSSSILHYSSSAVLQILSRPQLDQTILHIYAYDTVVYEFEMVGEEVRCTVVDRSIQEGVGIGGVGVKVKDCRERLPVVMEAIRDMCEGNQDNKCCFAQCFNYVYMMTKQTGAKYFIIQTSQLISTEPFALENMPKSVTDPHQRAPVSVLQSRNDTFLNKYGNTLFINGNSIAMFVWANSYKNLRVFNDTFKLVNCQLKYYGKDGGETELERFYYELSFLLSATFFKNVRTEFLVSQGWNFLSIYSNSHRIRQHVTFAAPQWQPSRQFFVQLAPAKQRKADPQLCAVQIIVNYRYKKQHYVTVATAVQTITESIPRLYSGVNGQMMVALIAKGLFSNLRTDHPHTARRRLFQLAYGVYRGALSHFKSYDKIPDTILYILQGTLAMFKNYHSQPDAIPNSILFDRLCAQRLYLHTTNHLEMSAFFVPYLFDLSVLKPGMCQEGEQGFSYPPTMEVKFDGVREGIFLMDYGLGLYLFISRKCDMGLYSRIFGREKYAKQHPITEQILQEQTTEESRQVLSLVQFLRSQKAYGWVPLYIVHCGDKTPNERNFYLQFYSQKYDEFLRYKGSFQQYLEMLKKNNEQPSM